MTLHFQPGQRVRVAFSAAVAFLTGSGEASGAVAAFLPRSGLPGPDGIRCDRVRVKLDNWPRPLIFNANDMEPV